jgi:hypothetical protein
VKKVRFEVVFVLAVALLGLTAASLPALAGASVKLTVERASGAHGKSASTPATSRLRHQGYLVPDQRGYERAKARAAARAEALSVRAPASADAALAPTTVRSWHGVNDPNVAPSDSTGAVGTDRFIETINDVFAVYDKTSNAPIATGTLQDLWQSGSGTTDPQMLWDPGTKRFYYAGLDFSVPTNNLIEFGYSKTATPNDETDFCHFFLQGYGSLLPDYPKLGDIKGHIIIGVNTFSGNSYVRSDALTVSKPPKGRTCVDPATFLVNQRVGLLDADGTTEAFTPVPANQTDTSKTGYVIATEGNGLSPSTKLTVFKIGTNADGTTNIQAQGKTVNVSSYSIPPNVPQKNTTNLLDSLDGRLTQAVSAIDPAHSGKLGLWTQQTVAGGAGTEVRWYEIDPVARTLLQSGKATSATLYAFNGAISPNRAVNGASATGGGSMVMGYDTSSASAFPGIKAVSKVGAGAQSSPLAILTSPNPDIGFDCGADHVCRWGDYAAATPDPNPPSGSRVWLVSMYNNGTSTAVATWKTQNFVVSP